MTTYDLPEPPDGAPLCRRCGMPLMYDDWIFVWFCPNGDCPNETDIEPNYENTLEEDVAENLGTRFIISGGEVLEVG